MQAVYKQSDLDERVRELERTYVPKFAKQLAGPLAVVVGVVFENRLVVRWSFP